MLAADKFSHACRPSDTVVGTLEKIFPVYLLTSSAMFFVLWKGQNLMEYPEATFESLYMVNGAVLNVCPQLDVSREYSCCEIDD